MRTHFHVWVFVWLFEMTVNLSAQNFIYIDTLLPDDYKVFSVSVVDSQVVWAVASQYNLLQIEKEHLIKVLKTTDSGASWQVLDVYEAKGRLSLTIAGRSAQEAWITTNDMGGGAGKGLLKTTDGGRSWQTVLQHQAGGVLLCFFDENHIYCQNHNSLALSANGGLTWQFDTLQLGQDEYIHVTSGNNNVAFAGDTVWVGTSTGRILRCTEYGKNCTFLEHNLLSDSLKISSIAFRDHQNGLFSFYSGKKIASTSDGGKTWEVLEGAPFGSNEDFFTAPILLECTKGDHGRGIWAVSSQGSIGCLYKTTDLGQTWTMKTIPGIPFSLDSGPDGQMWVPIRDNPRKFIEHVALGQIKYLHSIGRDDYTSSHILHAVENLHALSLFKDRRQFTAPIWVDMPKAIIQQEQYLRNALTDLEKKHFETTNNPLNTGAAETESTKSEIEAIQRQYDNLIQNLDSSYPEFQRQRADLHVVHGKELRSDIQLTSAQTVVEYFLTDSSIWIIYFQKDREGYKEIKKDFPLDQWVAELRSSLTAFHTDPNMANSYDSLAATYTALAHRLYEKLLAPVADSLPEHLIIVPDGALGYLPFEVLLTAPAAVPARWQDHAYLLKKHSISYAYSATMLREMTVHPHLHEPTVPFYGFAPRYDGDTSLLSTLFPGADLRKDLSPLPHTGEEVFKAAKLMGGKYFTGKQASEDNFRAKAPEARILHLATHGQANDRAGDYCFLVFADQKDSAENEILYARDIYNLQINADLVTLSACETGIGELQSSEGIISLARAFAYAGAKSIVTSLWSVSDAKTKDLMIDFYKNLRKGMLKDDALRQAKLDFLKRNRGQEAHPFYWAGFVGIGNMGGIR